MDERDSSLEGSHRATRVMEARAPRAVDGVDEEAALTQFRTLWTRFELDARTLPDDDHATLRPQQPGEGDWSAELASLPRLWGDEDRGGAGPMDSGSQRASPDDGLRRELSPGDTLGEGGMAIVHAAHQRSVGREVAVKRLRPDLADSRAATLGLLSEGRAMGALAHPNIVPVYMLGRDEQGQPLIVMKRVEGIAWSELIADPGRAPGEFAADEPLEMHLEVLSQVCLAVHFAHARGVLHRDLKPSNVMLGEHGEVYVLDWGLAVGVGAEAPTWLPAAREVRAPAGTPAYMAPEQAEGRGEALGVWTDVYLLGAVLHELLTGRAPHRGETIFQVLFHASLSPPLEYPLDVPPVLAEIARRAMERDPRQRFASVAALRHALIEARRHHASLQLTGEARRRARALARALEGAGGEERGRVYRLFGACRFGFEQALRVWPENAAARHGLREALREMAAWELAQGAYDAAAVLIADLPEPDPALDARLAALARERDARLAQVEALKELRHQSNLELGRASRSWLCLILGVSMSAMLALLGVNERLELFTFNYPLYLIHWLSFALASGAGVWFWRARLLQNQVNRQLSFALVAIVCLVLAYRFTQWQGGTALPTALGGEMLVYAGSLALLGVTVDLSIFWAVGPYLLANLASALWPEHTFWIAAVGNLLAMGLLAWVWRDCRSPAPGGDPAASRPDAPPGLPAADPTCAAPLPSSGQGQSP